MQDKNVLQKQWAIKINKQRSAKLYLTKMN